jgi:glycosyltransferase involved in cell wall biosynthesis
MRQLPEAPSKRVAFCIPTLTRPYQVCLDSLAASVPLIQASGWEDFIVHEIGCPYVSNARATMLRKALDAKADTIVFIDHDLSWNPHDLLTLLETEGDVVAGVYRFKKPEVEYMGALMANDQGTPIVRGDGAMLAHSIPAGFLKVTRKAVAKFIKAYPELLYGDPCAPSVDLFNHGAHNGVWWGEDYAFARNWRDAGGQIWIVPDLNLNHHTSTEVFAGNFHEYMMQQPGGMKDPARLKAVA